ncbi:hypothetical protein MBLNU230_g6197t1 [Neophaeotheca triangularis]
MPIPTYGAAPLAKSFLLVRGLSLVAMISIVGMTAHFVSQIVSINVEAPEEVIGTLAVTSIAALYCLITIPIFYSQANLSLLIMTALDTLLLLAFIVVSVLLGKPVSYLNCATIADANAAANAKNAAAFSNALAQNWGKSGSTLGLGDWAGSTKVNCYQVKAVWGCCVALGILFFCSVVLLPLLWVKAKRAGLVQLKGQA